MAKGLVELGTKWGRLECIEVGTKERTIEFDNGVSEILDNQAYWVARCQCGTTVQMWEKDFKGKRQMKDCGCDLSLNDGAIVVMCASVPLELKNKIVKLQHKQGGTFSRTLRDLIEKGLNGH